MKKINAIPGAPAAIGPYSRAVESGNLYFLSGQIPVDPNTDKLVSADLSAQATQVFKNIDTILNFLGVCNQNIVKSTIFITNIKEFALVNELYAVWLGEHRPARSTVEVSALPMGASIEIEVIAEKS